MKSEENHTTDVLPHAGGGEQEFDMPGPRGREANPKN